MLTHADVAPYLLRRGLLDAEAVTDGDLVVRDVSSRNRNFKVETSRQSGYLLKQGQGLDGETTIAHEAAVYQSLSPAPGLASYLPRFVDYDQGERVLILELVSGAESMRDLHLRLAQFPADIGASAAAAIAALHVSTGALIKEAARAERAPWILSFHKPDMRVFRDISSASIELIKIVQRTPSFGEHLDELRSTYGEQSLTHNDIKWDNFLVRVGSTSEARETRLIDWEAAGPGDRSWTSGPFSLTT